MINNKKPISDKKKMSKSGKILILVYSVIAIIGYAYMVYDGIGKGKDLEGFLILPVVVGCTGTFFYFCYKMKMYHPTLIKLVLFLIIGVILGVIKLFELFF